MSRYIDADLLKQCVQDNITRYFTCGTGGYCLAEDVVEDIDTFPTADVVELKHGEWIKQKTDPEVMKEFHDMGLGKGMNINSVYWTCSECKNWGTPAHKYCSSCGAKMDGERREG